MVAEDFVKSAAVEKHPTIRNTHYYERQVTEEDAEVPRAPAFHIQPLKAAKAVRTPPSPHAIRTWKSTMGPITDHTQIIRGPRATEN